MLNTVQEELEKEYIMQNIQNNTPYKFSSVDFQTLLYLLSMKGLITVADFATMYNRFHDKQNIKYIYENMIDPLIQKGILKVIKVTNKELFMGKRNEIIQIDQKVIDYDSKEAKKLIRAKY